MLKRLRVKNFRSIADSKNLNLSKLNILVGPNNSGKSSILYALLLLKQTLEDKDSENVLVTSGPHVDLGSYLDIVREHKATESLGIEFDLDERVVPEIAFIQAGVGKEESAEAFDKYDLKFRFEPKRNEILVASFALSCSKSRTVFSGERRDSGWVMETIPENLQSYFKPGFDHFLPFLQPRRKRPRTEDLQIAVANAFFRSHMRIGFLSHLFRQMLYVGPIREHIPRYGVLGTMPYSELGPSGQNLMRVLSQVTRRGASRKTVLQELNYWLDERFKLLRKVRILDVDKGKTVKALLAEHPRGGARVNLAATGSGISQLVPVVVQTVLTPKTGCLIVEQPEIHLHPAAQANLADLFVHYAQEGKQLVVETHSEHLLLRVRRRIAEGKISPDLVRIFLVEKSGKATRIRYLKLEKNGHFQRWPKGFFEEGYKEAIAIAEAQPK